ncbi:DUF983 domain-containing protein [Nitratireductor sp. CAU 1489]|uniref:DUF983 domain-containing protein n=1 Tax=Nitratireductor arenosus TaxID=2682096 RepID=A0A844QHI5_9HYPH|nr:DUF983 domain-containing protein [Nitratireductor arenosus]MVA98922.1 DUF983 domain-containing protein [Nitratireductor arenosus]
MDARKFGGAAATKLSDRPLWQAMKRGFLGRCPHCGQGRLFATFIRTAESCNVCGEEFHHHRADDLPAYLVMVIVGHVIVGAFMGIEAATTLSTWQHLAIWVPITIVSALALLQPTKGAVVGLQWALRMHGFGGPAEELETHPEL